MHRNHQILLVNPPYLNASQRLYHPSGLVALASYISREPWSTSLSIQILDLNLEFLFDEPVKYDDLFTRCFENIKNNIVSRECVIGFTTYPNSYPLVLDLSKKIKQYYPQSTIVLGGPQATLTSTRTMQLYGDYIDHIVEGEGERSFSDLVLKHLQHEEVPRIIKTELIKDINCLPYQDLKYINLNKYKNDRHNYLCHIEAGRGCAYKCAYCSATKMWSNKFRFKDVTRFIDELEYYVHTFDIKSFHFSNDNLTINKKYILNICDEIITRGLNIEWRCFSRIDQLDNEIITKMARSGCKSIFIGIESFSQHILNKINKRYTINHQGIKGIMQCLADSGISTTVSLMYGFPFETNYDIAENINYGLLLKIFGAENVVFSILELSAQTQLYNDYKCKMQFYTPPSLQLSHDISDTVERYILSDKEIFSSFYSLQPTLYDHLSLLELKQYFSELSDRFPKTIYSISKLLGIDVRAVINSIIEFSHSYDSRDLHDLICCFIKAKFKYCRGINELLVYEEAIWYTFYNGKRDVVNGFKKINHAKKVFNLNPHASLISIHLQISDVLEAIFNERDILPYLTDIDECQTFNYVIVYDKAQSTVKSYLIDDTIYNFLDGRGSPSQTTLHQLINNNIIREEEICCN